MQYVRDVEKSHRRHSKILNKKKMEDRRPRDIRLGSRREKSALNRRGGSRSAREERDRSFHGAQSSLAPRCESRGGKVVLGRADVPPWDHVCLRVSVSACVRACIRDRPATKVVRPHVAALPRFRPFRYVDTTRGSL